MAVIVGRCHSCGSEIDVQVGQSVQGDGLVWYRSYACGKCGNKLEEDGKGQAPADIRNASILQEGEWSVTLQIPGTEVSVTLKLLRQILGLSLVEVGQLRNKIPGVVFVGTTVEANRLAKLLTKEGLLASIAPATDANEYPTPHGP